MADLNVRGLRFFAQVMGSAEPVVVFLHGLVMDNLSSWYFTLANPVARQATTLLYDLRGHGRSERPASGYGVAEMVADLHAIRDAAGLMGRPTFLVGNSFGGVLSLAYTMAHPRDIAGLVLVDGQLADAAWASGMKTTLDLEGAERDAMIASSFQSWLGRHSARKRTKLATRAAALVYETSLREELAATEPFTDADLARITCPGLGIYGGDSDVLGHGERLARVLPAFELRVYPGCTHSVLWERTEELKAEVLAWLAPRLAAP